MHNLEFNMRWNLNLLVNSYVQGLRVAADEAKNAEAQAACRTLAQELTEQRFPAPRMLSFKVT
jgi:hypothetical protein